MVARPKPIRKKTVFFLLEKDSPTSGRYTICESLDALISKVQSLVDAGQSIDDHVAVEMGSQIEIDVRKVVEIKRGKTRGG